LDEREAARRRPRVNSSRPLAERPRREDPAAGRPDEPGTGPRHAGEKPAAVDAIAVALLISDALIVHSSNSFAVIRGAGRTRPRLRDDSAVQGPKRRAPARSVQGLPPKSVPTWTLLNSGAKLAICCFKPGSGSSVQ